MKLKFRHILAAVMLLALHAGTMAQQQQGEVKLQDLQAPYSPAFILLDVAPTLIERPTTAKAFATSIINSVAENNGIPENYAVEFTPFWFFKHPGFTAYKYYGINAAGNANKPFAGLRMTAVSLAFVNKMTGDAAATRSNNISFGLRTTLVKVISGKDREALVAGNTALLKKLNPSRDILANISMDIIDNNNLLDESKEKLKTEANPSTRLQLQNNITGLELKSANLARHYAATLDSLANDPEITLAENLVKEVLARRPLFSVDAAAAVNWAFKDLDFNSSYLDRAGAWMTMNLSVPLAKRTAKQQKYYLGVYASGRYLSGRMMNEEDPALREDCLDAGGKLELELNRFTVSYEYMYRYNFTVASDHSYRSSGLLKYKISDAIALSAAFGKNFGNLSNLIAQLGLNWSFGSGNESAQTSPVPDGQLK
jgi:hypothetical protein